MSAEERHWVSPGCEESRIEPVDAVVAAVGGVAEDVVEYLAADDADCNLPFVAVP